MKHTHIYIQENVVQRLDKHKATEPQSGQSLF